MATLSVPSSLDASAASEAPWWALHRDGPRHLGSGMRDCVPNGVELVSQLLYGLRRVSTPSVNGRCGADLKGV